MRNQVMYIVIVLCILSFAAGIFVQKGYGAEDPYAAMGIVKIVAPGENSPVKQMHVDLKLDAFVIYYAPKIDYDNIDGVFDKFKAIKAHFAQRGVDKGRVILGMANVKEWHNGIEFDKGEGIYLILAEPGR